MGKPFDITPRDVPPVATPFRHIRPPVPHPDSVPILETLRRCEPRSMTGQPPVLWNRAEGFQVWDGFGNMWLDWSSGVLVANAGHGHPAVVDSIRDQCDRGLLHNYCFPSAERARLVELLLSLAPPAVEKCFLLTTGSEATECCLKLMRTWGQRTGGTPKIGIIAFHNAFHGRTMGAQQMGDLGDGHRWIVHLDPAIHRFPFPDGFRNKDTGFEAFEAELERRGLEPSEIAGVITETYQGAGPFFLPREYAQRLRRWCDEHKVLLCFDSRLFSIENFGDLAGEFHFYIAGVVFAACHAGFEVLDHLSRPTRHQSEIAAHGKIGDAHHLPVHILGGGIQGNMIAQGLAHPYHAVGAG